MIKPYISLVIVFVVLALGIHFYLANKTDIVGFLSPKATRVESIGIEGQFFVVKGQNLSAVEVWGIPTGTSVTEEGYQKLGNAAKAATLTDQEIWRMPIPVQPILLSAVFAKGLAKDGKEANRVMLPVTGATDVYNALWGSTVVPGAVNEVSLKPGQKGTANGVTISFNKIVEDSRCPAGVYCIQAGSLTVSITVSTPEMKATTQELKLPSAGLTVGGHVITIGRVDPLKKAGVTPENTEYTVRFVVEKK